MSTRWYAQRVLQVVSIEDYQPWFTQVSRELSAEAIQNVVYRFATDRGSYVTPTKIEAEGGFDLIMVDGKYRDACVNASINLLRPGGILYLDNSDRGTSDHSGDTQAAVGAIREFARERGAELTLFTDFAPAQFVVQQGLAMRLP